MKRIWTTLLATVLLLAIMPLGAITAYAAEVEFDYYVDMAELDGDLVEGAVITGAYGDVSGDLVIPDVLEGYPVVRIGDWAFEWQTEITSVEIPDTVTSIGCGAFSSCYSLEQVWMGCNVEIIEHNAFSYCGRCFKHFKAI